VAFAVIRRESHSAAQLTAGLARTATLCERLAERARSDRRCRRRMDRRLELGDRLIELSVVGERDAEVRSGVDRVRRCFQCALEVADRACGVTFVQQRIAQIEMRVCKIRVDVKRALIRGQAASNVAAGEKRGAEVAVCRYIVWFDSDRLLIPIDGFSQMPFLLKCRSEIVFGDRPIVGRVEHRHVSKDEQTGDKRGEAGQLDARPPSQEFRGVCHSC